MEGLEAYDVVEDIEVEIIEVIEDNMLDNEDIDMDYNVFIDDDIVEGNVQELGDVNSPELILIYTFHNLFHEPFIFL